LEKAKRKKIVAANWKMNKTCAETVSFLSRLLYMLEEKPAGGVEIIIFPPFTALRSASTFLQSEKKPLTNLYLGAQNMFYMESGAYTGEISPLMLKEFELKYVLLGHSERRNLFGESDDLIIKKVKTAVEHGFTPLICVGETLEQREKGETEQVLRRQCFGVLEILKNLQFEDFVIAYEPVWAIGTGIPASPEEANDVIRHIRALVGSVFSPEVARKVRILYGGSVDIGNFRDFLLESDIDGGLVGTASLDVEKFVKLIETAASIN
jgi:triosephosphate isomerase